MLNLILAAIGRVRNPYWFRTELGYQGELLGELRTQIAAAYLPGGMVVEQEYQKRFKDHGLNTRPDLIVHIPTGPGESRRVNNFAVFELNCRAGPKEVFEDFANLDAIVDALDYPLAVFINVGSGQTHARYYAGPFRERLHCIAVRHATAGFELRHACFLDGHINESLLP